MNKIITFFRKISFILLGITFLVSCSKDENKNEQQLSAPIIESLEIGEQNAKTAYIADEFHLEATFIAEAGIKEVKLQITYPNGDSSVRIEQTFPEFVGLKGGHIHKHFDIPADAKEGNYDFLLTITGQNDKKISVKETIVVEKKIDFTENNSLSLSTLQLGVLNKTISMPRADFLAKLQSENVSFDQGSVFDPITYYATRNNAPFARYKVEVSFANVFDLDIRPYQLYDGVDTITLIPVDDNGEEITNDQPEQVFKYFQQYISSFNPNVYQYIRQEDDKDYVEKGFTKEEFYKTFTNKSLKETDAIIVWNANPNKPVTESSKEKNTPIITLKYVRATHTWQITLEFNRPWGYANHLKNN